MEFNKYQTSIEDLHLEDYPQEVVEEFYDALNSVQYIKNLVSSKRPLMSELPRDEKGRAIIDLANPPIFEDVDYFRLTALKFKKDGKFTDLRPNANPNSEYGKWMKQEVDRCWYGMVRPEDGAWVSGDMYFYLNYVPIIQSKIIEGTKTAERIVDFPEFWEGIWWRFVYMEYALKNGRHSAEIAKRGAGKAHPYFQEVLTPKGLKKWGDINIGDLIYGDDGNITKVIDIPFNDECDIYRLTLKDGRQVYASGDHLWKLDIHNHKHQEILSTNELNLIYKRKRKVTTRNPNGIEYTCSIPVNKPIEFYKKETLVDPYTFGLLLGDGCFRHLSCYYTCKDEDFEVIRNYIPYEITKWSGKYQYRIHIKNWNNILKKYGLNNLKSEDKFIPDEYKFNSKEIRINILKGLIDSDGYINSRRGTYHITLSSEKMINDISFICRSLGMNCSYSKRKSGYKKNGIYIECLPCYVLNIYTKQILSNLPRKQNISKFKSAYSRSHIERTRIVNIEYIGKDRAKCVTVDNNSNCYLIGDFVTTHNSYSVAAMLTKMFVIGLNKETSKRVRGMVMAYQKEYLTKDGTLNKFEEMKDFLAENTQWPYKTLTSSLDKMQWVMGYKDLETNAKKGTGNEIIGVSAKDDPDKGRGKRLSKIIIEEFGNFPKITDTYRVMLPSVQEGDIAFGLICEIGTGGSEGNDFAGAMEMIYNPLGYNILPVLNVYDKALQGKSQSIFFFGACVNRKGCYNNDGISDITKALLEICHNRYIVKYNTSDPMALTRTKAENPITLQEAIMKRDGSMFPVAQLIDRIDQLKQNHSEYDDVYVGELTLKSDGSVGFKPTNDLPIRFFPHSNNKLKGALEIFKMPEKDLNDKVFPNRYILSCDPYDDDTSLTLSLGSVFVLDLWTDMIVAEYTGRPLFADDFYEIARRMCIFYNGKMNYENNKKGIFAYFKQMNSLYLLTLTFEYLRDRDDIKGALVGNKAWGTPATEGINYYGRTLLRDWLLKPCTIVEKEGGEEKEITIPNLMRIRNLALLIELSQWNPDGNFDRVSSMGMMMLYRQDRMIVMGGDLTGKKQQQTRKDYIGNDDYFTRNYDNRFNVTIQLLETN